MKLPVGDLLIGELPRWEAGVCTIVPVQTTENLGGDLPMRELIDREDISLHNQPTAIAVFGENDHLLDVVPADLSAREVGRRLAREVVTEHSQL